MKRILAFVPAYNCERQIGRAIAQFDKSCSGHIAELIVVDNRSMDGTADAAISGLRELRSIRGRLLQNDANYGLGGSHKVAFNYALANGFDHCLVFHGDDQGRLRDALPFISRDVPMQTDCLLGARFMPGSKLVGYSRFRTLGNRAFNRVYSIAAGRRLLDLGSGLNLYATAALADRFYLRLPNDLTFNYALILASCARQWRMQFFPIEWREEDQLSNVKLVRQAFKALRIAASYRWSPTRFLSADRSGGPSGSYTSRVLFDTAAPEAARES